MNDITSIAIADYVSLYEAYHRTRDEIREKGGTLARELRRDTRLSLNKFAAALGVSPSYLSKIENGHSPLGAEIAKKMLEVHRCR
jgi:DNA-binding transcriptional regulator YiaG